MENINKIIKDKINNLNSSSRDFKSIFEIIHNLENNIFSEISDGYKIKTLTYKENKEKCILIGKYISNELKSVKKNTYVGLMMDNSPLWVHVFWGLLMAGFKPMLLNIRLGSKLNQEIINLLDIKYVFCDKDYNLNCSIIYAKDINTDKYNKDECEFEWANEIALSTSATSLNIKICVYKGQDIASQITNTKHIVNENSMIKKHYKGKLKIMAFLPFYHIFGLIATYFWFSFFGRTIVFLKDFSNETILKTARKHKVTHIFAVPMVWNTIAKEITKEISSRDEKTQKRFDKGIKLSNKVQNIWPSLGLYITRKLMSEVQNKIFGNTIKFLITGGGYISQSTIELINGIGYPLYNGYGMSEIGITSVELRKKIKYRNLSTIGKPLPTVEYKIEDEKLLVKGSSICSKIITKNETKEIDHNEWFETNDLTKIDNKGHYYILGRNDDVVVSQNGEKINPDLIEKNIQIYNAKRFCILGLDFENVKKLSLVVEISSGLSIIKKNKLIEEIEKLLIEFKNQNYNIEKVYFTTDKIAADTAIKVSRSILVRKIDNCDVTLIPFSDFKSNNIVNDEEINKELIKDVTLIFGEVLSKNIQEININDHFIFDLGGSSLEYLTLLIKLKEKFEIDFNFVEGENCYTVYEVVNYILKRGK